MAKYPSNNELDFIIPPEYHYSKDIGPDGVEILRISYGYDIDTNGEIFYHFNCIASGSDVSDLDGEVTSSNMLEALAKKMREKFIRNITHKDISDDFKTVRLPGKHKTIIESVTVQFPIGDTVEMHFSFALIQLSDWSVLTMISNSYISKTNFSFSKTQFYNCVYDVLKAVRIDGKALPLDKTSPSDLYNGDGKGGMKKSKSKSGKTRFTKVSPDESLYPHYKSNRTSHYSESLNTMVIVNLGGTQYNFIPFRETCEDSKALVNRVIAKDTTHYDLDKTAKKMQKLFHVRESAFNPSQDREGELEQGLMRKAYMMSALRSFAWTLADYCKKHKCTPNDIDLALASQIVDFVAEEKWLNYDGSTHCQGLCSCSDLHVYFLPDGVSQSDKNKLLPSRDEIAQIKRLKELFPNFNEITIEIGSLSELRKDLKYIYPAVQLLWDGLKATRNYNEELSGNEADVVYAWCALALAAKEPFFVEDGPMNCSFDHPGDEAIHELNTAPKTGSKATSKAPKRGRYTHFYSEEAIAEKEANKAKRAKRTTEKPKPSKTAAVYEGPAKMTIVDGQLKKYEGNEEMVVVPEGITTIGRNAFKDNKSLKKVVLPESLLIIDDSAFENCSELVDINWINSIEGIGNRAFKGCASLETVIIPGNTFNILQSTFRDCPNIKTLVVHPNVDYICDTSYERPFDFSNDRTIYIEKGSYAENFFANKEIAYNYPRDLMPRCTLSEEEKKKRHEVKIWNNTFLKYNGKDDIFIIPIGIRTIESNAFVADEKNFGRYSGRYSVNNTLKRIFIPNTVKSAKEYAFAGCVALESVEIPHGFKILNSGIFSNCTNLKYVTLPESMKKIYACAFLDCPNLRSINMPSSLMRINNDAFGGGKPPENLTIFGEPGTIAEQFANAHKIRFSTGLPLNVPAPRNEKTVDPTIKALEEKRINDERRKREEQRKKIAEERRKREVKAKIEEEERLKALNKAKFKELSAEKFALLQVIEENKFALFGEKAKKRKEAKQKLDAVENAMEELSDLLKN